MSTRSVIAKPNGDGWKGRYVHFDGYPHGVGLTIFVAIHDGALTPAQVVEKFVDNELVGWSVLSGTDLTLEPAWTDDYVRDDKRPLSYSQRGETPYSDDPTGDWIYHDGDDGGTEYAYVVGERELYVLGRTYGNGEQAVGFFGMDTGGTHWRLIAAVPYTATTAEYLQAVDESVRS